MNYEKSLHYFKLAAERGSVQSYGNIGYMYTNGLGATKSDETAFPYFKVGLARVWSGKGCFTCN